MLRRLVAPVSALALVAILVGAQPASAEARAFTVHMTGAQEPLGGDPNGSGVARIVVDTHSGQICYVITARGLSSPPVAAHIHEGPPGVAGPVVVPLKTPVLGRSAGCVHDPEEAAEILEDPGDYYVNVHTAVYPAGAIRGQL